MDSGAYPVLGISGSVGPSRRTSALVHAVLDAVASADPQMRCGFVELQSAGLPFCDGRPPAQYTGPAAALIQQAAEANALVVGTPVYRASVSGVLKNFLDIVSPDAMAGKPVCMAVSGGSRDHFLVGDYALRPILSALGMHTLPEGIYSDPSLMPEAEVGPDLQVDVQAAARRLVEWTVRSRAHLPPIPQQEGDST